MVKDDKKVEINSLDDLDELKKVLKSCHTTLSNVAKKLTVSDDVKVQSKKRDSEEQLQNVRNKFVWDLESKIRLLDTWFETGNLDYTIPDKISAFGYDEISYISEQLGRDKFLQNVSELIVSAREKLEDLLPPVVEGTTKKNRSYRPKHTPQNETTE